jgi:alkylation response protein AidB-like acyl-CoA dehydrogenase
MIAFEPTDEQRMLIQTVRAFAEEHLRRVARESDETGQVPEDVIAWGWSIGLLPSMIPEAYGGFGEPSALTSVLALEELGWGDFTLALYLLAPHAVALPILLYGTEEQKRTYLPRFCGERFVRAAAALIEPSFLFDPSHLRTTARREGEEYVLHGTKIGVPFGAEAELLLVYASEDGRTQAFLVEPGTPGLTVKERDRYAGIRALPTYEVVLEGCRIPRCQRIGGEEGISMERLLERSRVALAALAVGLARGAFEYARDYAKQRVQFGEPIAHRQAIAFMIAEMAIDIDAARLMVWEAAWKLDRGEDVAREAYLAKLFADDMALRVTDGAVQTLGGHGYIRDHPVEMWLRNARGLPMLEGLVMV